MPTKSIAVALSRGRTARSLLSAVMVLALATGSCVRDGDAQVPTATTAAAVDDTASVARLLASVRGVNALSCELVARSVDMHGWWTRWGSLGGDPLEVDSAAAALVRWIQRDHDDPAVVPRLRVAMRDSDPCVRRVAASFLGRVQHSSALSALMGALEDPNAETRYVAALGLGLSDDQHPTNLEPLMRRLEDDSPSVRRAAAWALGALEHQPALERLIERLQRDSDARVRQAAAWAIGQISG
jgi:hypothetical protein